MALRTRVLEYLEREPSDFPTLLRDLGSMTDLLAAELYSLLQAGYVIRSVDLYYLTDRGREYLKIERREY
jgi:DNA-binding HxlR family transcriptional regulator